MNQPLIDTRCITYLKKIEIHLTKKLKKKSVESINKPLHLNEVMKYHVAFFFYMFLIGCKRSDFSSNPVEEVVKTSNNEIVDGIGEELDMETYLEIMASHMGVLTEPETLIFDKTDSIPIKFDCTYRDSALCCGTGRIYFVINDTFDFNRIMANETAYIHESCMSGETIYLRGLDKGIHQVNGIITWQKGAWWFNKELSKSLIIN